jgi:hypothetical protein
LINKNIRNKGFFMNPFYYAFFKINIRKFQTDV